MFTEFNFVYKNIREYYITILIKLGNKIFCGLYLCIFNFCLIFSLIPTPAFILEPSVTFLK